MQSSSWMHHMSILQSLTCEGWKLIKMIVFYYKSSCYVLKVRRIILFSNLFMCPIYVFEILNLYCVFCFWIAPKNTCQTYLLQCFFKKEKKKKERQCSFTLTCDVPSPPLVHVNMVLKWTRYLKEPQLK